MNGLFPGFRQRRVRTSGAAINLVQGGVGPPLLLLHGYPQTHAIWHRVAPELAKRQGSLLVSLTRWYTPAEALGMATGANGELLALSGDRSPYRGKLGVVEEGALADLLLVDGDPLKNIKLIEEPAKNFLVIMKDGRIYKNTVPR